jgi:hypothetical protein
MGFNSAFKGLKLLKTPGKGRLNNLNDPVLNVLRQHCKDKHYTPGKKKKKKRGPQTSSIKL